MYLTPVAHVSHDELVEICRTESYSETEANQQLLKLQDYLAHLATEIAQAASDKQAEWLREQYSTLVIANNHVLRFASEEFQGLSMNALRIPTLIESVRSAFHAAEAANGDRNPSRSDMVLQLRKALGAN